MEEQLLEVYGRLAPAQRPTGATAHLAPCSTRHRS